MINGSYSFGSSKINLENEINSFKDSNFKKLFKKTGIKYIYRTKKCLNCFFKDFPQKFFSAFFSVTYFNCIYGKRSYIMNNS